MIFRSACPLEKVSCPLVLPALRVSFAVFVDELECSVDTSCAPDSFLIAAFTILMTDATLGDRASATVEKVSDVTAAIAMKISALAG